MENKTICEEKFNRFLVVGGSIKSIKAKSGKKPALLEIVIPDDLASKLLTCATNPKECKIGSFYLCWKDNEEQEVEEKQEVGLLKGIMRKNRPVYVVEYGLGKVSAEYEVNFVVDFYDKSVYFDYNGYEYKTEIKRFFQPVNPSELDYDFYLGNLELNDRVFSFKYGAGTVIDVCQGWRCIKVRFDDKSYTAAFKFSGVEYDVGGDRLIDNKRDLIKIREEK